MYISGIGVKLNRNLLYETVKTKRFDHNYSEEWKYDPISGELLWEEKLIKNPQIKENSKSDLKAIVDIYGFLNDFPIIIDNQDYYLLFDYMIIKPSQENLRSENIFNFSKNIGLEKIILYKKDYKITGEVKLILIQCI